MPVSDAGPDDALREHFRQAVHNEYPLDFLTRIDDLVIFVSIQ